MPQLVALDVAFLRSEDPHAAADPHAVCVAALGVVRALAERGPVVLAVDDVDWLDRASERVLRYVVRRLSAEPVGVLVARRPYGDREPPLGLADRPRYRRIKLGPLAVDDLQTLLVERHGLSLPPRTVRRIHELCAGNPFVAVELVMAVRREGRHVLADAVVPLPNGVPMVTAQHIAGLSPGARAALAATALAAAPTVAVIDAVEAATGGIDAGLDEAVAAKLLEIADDRVGFIHPLLRRAVAAGLSPGERRSWHRTLACLVVDPDERAVHLAAATLGPEEDVARALEESAARAMARGAPDTAAALAVRAVDLTPEEPFEVRARRRIRAAEYGYRSEDFDPAAADLTELVGQLPAGELRAEALLWLATVRQAQNGVAEAIGLAARALAEAQTAALRAAAERDLALALVIAGQVPDADRHAEAALATARSTGDPVSITESEAALAWTRFWLGAGLRRDLLDVDRSRAPHRRARRRRPDQPGGRE